ncbi:MAG: arginine--tRNA ligase [Lachnospiraceae bacterium]|nr:arginine--tRNA ligase [Lachnospiraceae bacterium]MBQ7775635.1 arginine--tRNA ligase [Lachnospiraceae bacterium]
MKTRIAQEIAKQLMGAGVETDTPMLMDMLEVPPQEGMGDWALPCFSLAKCLHKSPISIAKELKEGLVPEMEDLGIVRMEAVGGYLNLFLERTVYVTHCMKKLQEEKLGVEQSGNGKTICMDYSSPNIAKNFHVGHLRTTVIGNSLYKIFDKLGYQVVRINHLGDWGTQFGKLIVAYKRWSSKEAVEEKGIEELMQIYVKFNTEAEQDSALMEEARSWFVKMEQNDEEALAIWEWFKEISMVEFERVYALLGISFDSYVGESFYRSKVPVLVEELQEKKLLQESQGANVIDLSAYDMPPCLITKRDGGSIYHSRDIAAVLYRKQKYNFEKCLYVTGLEQSLHFKQVFKAVEVMGYDWTEGLVHIPYGLVSLAGAKLSTRTGNIIYAEDILKEAVLRAKEVIVKKNPNLPDKDEVARMVGVGAVIFHDLFNQRIKNVDFSWEEVLSLEGTTGPYVQYTYARAKSILRKSDEQVKADAALATGLTDDYSYALIKQLSGYEEAIKKAAERYEPSVIARYLIDVTSVFNKFYQECPILKTEGEEKQARLMLVELTQRIIKECCGLLGMECPEEM